jgi:hypothetical protein
MKESEPISRLVARIVTQVRWRRAEHHALRALFYGGLVAVVVLALRSAVGPWAIPAAAGIVAVALIGGAIWGLLRPVPHADAARLADRAYDLQDRVATALEWSGRPDKTSLVDALVADAVERVSQLPPRQAIRRVLPREVRWLPIPAVAALALALAPPVPLPHAVFPNLSSSADADDPQRERTDAGALQQDRRALPRDPLRRQAMEERDYVQRAGTGAAATAGDLSAIFKDTSLATQRPDFNSFLKKGDERLKMLEQVDRLPDLQSDFTGSQYKMMFRKSKALTGGMRPDQLSPQKLKELLEEMERLGRKGGGNWGSDVSEGMEALEGGQPDRAMDAMERALNKLRAMEEQQRSGKNLRGGREANRGGRGSERGRGDGGGPDEQDFGEGEGLLPGKGKSANPKGEPSQRLRANPYDAGVEGESRAGRKDGFDTNMTGRGARASSRLSYLGVIGQYKKAMEDALAREQVPRDYHSQIKDYFQALDER